MTLNDAWRALLFQTEVRLYADAPPAAVQDRLADLLAPPFTRSRQLRRRPFRGRLTPARSVLRWKMSPTSPTIRELRFSLSTTSDGGSILSGMLVPQPLVRYAAVLWLAFVLFMQVSTLTYSIQHQEGLTASVESLLFSFLALLLGYAYLRWAGFLFGERDAQLVCALRVILASEAGSVIMHSYLLPSSNRFIDLPGVSQTTIK